MISLRSVPNVVLAGLVLPVAAGMWGVLAPVLGWSRLNDAAGATPIADVLAWPGLIGAIRLSVQTGILSTFGALALTVLVLALLHGSRTMALLRSVLSPLLSLPHAAAAFGIAFLIAPSGWIARALSPWATGWDRPPDLLILNDPWGIALTLGLITKEMPFLLLMSLAALNQIRVHQSMTTARALGHGRAGAWIKCILPQLYRQIRLPVYVVLAYGMSTVEMAIILGPARPPTLSVQILRWMSDPDLTYRLAGAAAALIQLALVVAAIGAWHMAERMVSRIGLLWISGGARSVWLDRLRPLAGITAIISAATVIFGIAGLLVWSFAGRWTFQSTLPSGWTLRSWQGFWPQLTDPIAQTALIAGASTLLALLLCITCLQAQSRYNLRLKNMTLLYVPLLVPQIAFLPGLQVLLIQWNLTSGIAVVTAVHVVFVLPYVFLSLSDPWQAWDRRYATVGQALGASPLRVLLAIRLPMMLSAVLTAAAVGWAVSVGQYLPTLLAGGGRVSTITTEAVALASGGDRRAIGVYGIVQTLAAFAPFAMALGLPRLIYRNRQDLRPARK